MLFLRDFPGRRSEMRCMIGFCGESVGTLAEIDGEVCHTSPSISAVVLSSVHSKFSIPYFMNQNVTVS